MTTTSIAPATSLAPRAARRRRRVGLEWLGRWAFRGLVAGLVGLNGWWLYRDLRPTPSFKEAMDLSRRGKDDQAIAAFREVLRRSPREGQARIALARLLAKKGDTLGCARELHRVPGWWPGRRETKFFEGESFRQSGLARPAEAAFRACVDDDPLHPLSYTYLIEASSQLIEIYAFEGRWDDAIWVVWNAYRQVAPAQRPTIFGMRIRLEMERMAPSVIVPKMRRYLAADPEDLDARRALALAEQALRHEAEADRQINLCLKADPLDLRNWRDRLKILADRGDDAALVAALKEMPATYPSSTDADLWEVIAQARLAGKDLEGAAQAYGRAVELRPQSANDLYRLASVEMRLGRHQLAAEHRRKSKIVREAGDRLTPTYLDYTDLLTSPKSTPEARAVLASRMVELCRTLGLRRETEAWTEIAARR